MPRLNNAQRNNAIGRLEAGMSRSEVARFFHVSPSTISRLWTRYQQQETTRDLPRSGRPCATTTAQDRYIRLRHLHQRMTTATSTASTIPGLGTISDQTVRNRLRDAGLRPRRPVRRIVLTRHHRQVRLQWCRQHRMWSQERWRNVWFSVWSYGHIIGKIQIFDEAGNGTACSSILCQPLQR
ncbi:Uncharacterised protein r2_g2496 [Pycnogonum litorale]